jgi:hypothetical protein
MLTEVRVIHRDIDVQFSGRIIKTSVLQMSIIKRLRSLFILNKQASNLSEAHNGILYPEVTWH